MSEHTSCMSFGVQVGDYAQLRAALGFLEEREVRIVHLPPELSPGIDYSAFAIDPDGHAIQLYYYMEQIGLGRPPAQGVRAAPDGRRLARSPRTRSPTPSPASRSWVRWGRRAAPQQGRLR